MQNIFIVPAMQHGCGAKPLYSFVGSNYISLGKEMFLILRTDLGQEYASSWCSVPVSNRKNVQAVW